MQDEFVRLREPGGRKVITYMQDGISVGTPALPIESNQIWIELCAFGWLTLCPISAR